MLKNVSDDPTPCCLLQQTTDSYAALILPPSRAKRSRHCFDSPALVRRASYSITKKIFII